MSSSKISPCVTNVLLRIREQFIKAEFTLCDYLQN